MENKKNKIKEIMQGIQALIFIAFVLFIVFYSKEENEIEIKKDLANTNVKVFSDYLKTKDKELAIKAGEIYSSSLLNMCLKIWEEEHPYEKNRKISLRICGCAVNKFINKNSFDLLVEDFLTSENEELMSIGNLWRFNSVLEECNI